MCFPCSVIATVLVAYSVVELMINIFTSRFPAWAKGLSMLLVLAIFCCTHGFPLVELDGFTFGHDNIFVWKFPVSASSRAYYLNFFSPVDVMFGMAEYDIAYCMLSWNIYNLALLLTAVFTLLLCYFSFAFFSLKVNAGYLEPLKKGVKKNENNQ